MATVSAPTVIDTPRGLFSASGVWFRAREADVRSYAGSVLEHESLEKLVQRAEVWLRSPETVFILLLPALLWAVGTRWAIVAAVGSYLVWKAIAPAMVNRLLGAFFRVAEHPVPQLVYYTIVLSVFAMSDAYLSLALGLAGFILARWGLMRKATDPLVRPLWQRLYPLPVADQVLRATIHRAAIAHRAALPQIDLMAEDILAVWLRTDSTSRS